VTAIVCPATKKLDERGVELALFETVKPTVPLPLPDSVDKTIQSVFEDVTQVHPAAAVTVREKGVVAAGALMVVGETVIVHWMLAACVTATGRPAIVSVADRGVVDVFASTT
jgi:hypothetical protein